MRFTKFCRRLLAKASGARYPSWRGPRKDPRGGVPPAGVFVGTVAATARLLASGGQYRAATGRAGNDGHYKHLECLAQLGRPNREETHGQAEEA